jgi:DNA-binding transcriptional regulator LsrR (DeoR family)
MKLEAAGLADRDHYTLPMTQEQIADATGLTGVHVNRVLQSLTSDGVISRDRRTVTMKDWSVVADAGQFTPDYLHPLQNQVAAS